MKKVEQQYKLLDEIEHVRQRPGMYVGSIVPTEQEQWIHHGGRFEKRIISYNPGLFKLFCEILDNSIDEHKRKPEKLDVIKVDIDRATGTISIYDNGGIPVVIHSETKQYIPTMIFTNLRAGSNFEDTEDQSLIGTNGVGSTLVCVLSQRFEIETADGNKKLHQVITNGLRNIGEPKITKCAKGYTKITFLPDYEYFGEPGLTEGNYQKMVKRVYDCAGCNPKIKFELNGEKINIKSFKDYIEMYECEYLYDSNQDWEVALAHSPDGFEQISFVNSVETYDGGTHIDYVLNPILNKLRDHFKKKYKLDVKPSDIKQQVRIFINCNINRPKFNSQTKSFMISEPRDYKTKWEVKDAFITKLLKSSIVASIVEWAEHKEALRQLAAQKQKNKELSRANGVRDIEKYETATSKARGKCILFVAEGDSAVNPLLSARDPEIHGVFPLKGKPINVREKKLKDLMENKELTNLMKIIGLEFGTTPLLSQLRYGRLVLATDQDLDGFHLCGLIINMFEQLWPDLIKKGFIYKLETPIVRVTQGKNEIEFMTLAEFEQWKCNQTKPFAAQYLKGLGSNDTKYFKKYMFDEKYMVPITLESEEDHRALAIAFDKTLADDRKDYIYGNRNAG